MRSEAIVRDNFRLLRSGTGLTGESDVSGVFTVSPSAILLLCLDEGQILHVNKRKRETQRGILAVRMRESTAGNHLSDDQTSDEL